MLLAVFIGRSCDLLFWCAVCVHRDSFSPVIQDTEELDEAVQYLHNQGGHMDTWTWTQHTAGNQACFTLSPSSLPPLGTILHFSDASLLSTYFLDPQWLTKMMAKFIGPSTAAEGKKPLIRDG